MNDLSDQLISSLSLPSWVTSYRPHQLTAISQVLEFFQTTNVVFMEAPTGSGKTLIAETIRQQLGKQASQSGKPMRGVYLCASIALQSQFHRDYPYAYLLKGRSNYPTLDNPKAFLDNYDPLSAADCTKQKELLPACEGCPTTSISDQEVPHCRWCHPVSRCPYEKVKASALRAELVCTNLWFYLYEANYVGNISYNRPFVVVDECDVLEDILMSMVEVRISSRRVNEFSIPPPARKTVASAWVDWLPMATTQLKFHLKKLPPLKSSSLKDIKKRTYITRLLANLDRMNDPTNGIAQGGWVYTGYEKGDIAFKPVRVRDFGPELFWRHGTNFLLMSATIVSAQEMAYSLGLDLYRRAPGVSQSASQSASQVV